MAHIRLYHKTTGVHTDVWSVDAKELLASGEYAVEDPHTGMQEGVPGETVMRPFDPTMHREDPASHPGDVVVTAPPRAGVPVLAASTPVVAQSGRAESSHNTPDVSPESGRRK